MTIGSKNSGIKKKGGKRAKKGKKFVPETTRNARYLLYKEKDQEYVRVVSMLGDCRLKGETPNGSEIICMIRGKFKKRVWINPGDIVLIGLRAFEDDKADVIHKFTSTEAKQLVKEKEIPQSMISGLKDEEEAPEEGIQFDQDKLLDSDSEQSDDNLPKENDDNDEEDNQRNTCPPQRELKNISDEEQEEEFDAEKALADL